MSFGPDHAPTPFFGRAGVRLPTGAESAAFDAWAIQELDVPGPVLMENAGRSAAAVVHRLHPSGRVAVVAGTGNNGGDGLVLARTLTAWGRKAAVFVVGERPEPEPLLHGWGVSVTQGGDDLSQVLAAFDVVVDALLGTGIRGAPREPQARAIAHMNGCGRPLVALDVPSGVDADGGEVPGEAVKAELTVSLGAPKLGTLLHPARTRAGRVVAVEIGFPPWREEDTSALLVTPGWARIHRPRRPPVTHKNQAGRLLLAAGSEALGGAVVLSAVAALRGGVGFLRVAVPAALRTLVQGAVPEAVVVDAGDGDALAQALDASDAVAMGPGLGTGPGSRDLVSRLLDGAGDRPVLLDADALNLLASGQVTLDGVERALLTPHPGEAARLLGREAAEVIAALPGAARDLAHRFGAATLLKGTPSVVAPRDPSRPLLVSASGSSDLARAGMGDTLTGAAGAFLARGAPPEEAAGLALHFTGRAAALAGAGEALLPTDVGRHLAAAVAEDGDGATSLELPFVLLDLPRLP